MKPYKVKISPEALLDIQDATDWYNKQVTGLGARFQKSVKQQIGLLKQRPEIYSLRYKNVHCMLIKKFPFLVHFTIDEGSQIVEVFAIFHTSRNPKIWSQRADK